jgi:tRNA uridine 5-carboxymethylaminomethyl modification enzyme
MPLFDVIVVGGGHAGCEAAAAAARVGARTLLLTQKVETIGELSCNPSIGGVGKGQLVREIDALDGLMGRVADTAAIQFRMLNRSKGPAVRGPRAQMDRTLYRAAMQAELAGTPGLTVRAGSVDDLVLSGGVEPAVRGVVLGCGTEIAAAQVILTTGTFLRGLIHRGRETTPAGRAGDAPSVGLALTLERLGFPLGRLKTGTPPRLDGRTIDWAACAVQEGDDPPSPFSFCSAAAALPAVRRPSGQRDCWSTRTTPAAQAIVAAAVARGEVPWFQDFDAGAEAPKGPRYCMAIETKVARFPERTHNIWLEPEGWDTPTIYPAGLSTGLPADVQVGLGRIVALSYRSSTLYQIHLHIRCIYFSSDNATEPYMYVQEQFLREIPGLAAVEVVAPGYCIEYDFIDPRQLRPTLESGTLPGLWLAGQINGTTGYEVRVWRAVVPLRR